MSASGPLITGAAAILPADPTGDSLESLIFDAASAALSDAGLERSDLDGVVIAASDQVDGRAISSMLTAGAAGAYLSEEANVASSPGHALVLAVAEILAATHRRVLVASWGKPSENATASTLGVERLSGDPFFERDVGGTPLSAAGMQAQRHRAAVPGGQAAAHELAARRQPDDVDADAIAASPLVSYPLRRREWPAEIDGAFALVLERADRKVAGVAVAGVGWCSDSGRLCDRDLLGLPHLRRAGEDARRRAGGLAAERIDTWHLHDYSPDAELLAYEALGLCPGGGSVEAVRSGATRLGGPAPVNACGGSLAGEAPFGGPLRKVVQGVSQLRDRAGENQVAGAEWGLAQLSSGFAGQFQTVVVLARSESR